MKEFLKDYGVAIGPLFAFILGVIAIYIKSEIDKKIDKNKSYKKLSVLIDLIKKSPPPPKYYPNISDSGFIHADQARNLTNISIFLKRLNVISMFIDKIENDILLNLPIEKIQQFHHIKFIVTYMNNNLKEIQENTVDHKYLDLEFKFTKIDLFEYKSIQSDYERLLKICNDPEDDFKYISN